MHESSVHPSLFRGAQFDRPWPISSVIDPCYDSILCLKHRSMHCPTIARRPVMAFEHLYPPKEPYEQFCSQQEETFTMFEMAPRL